MSTNPTCMDCLYCFAETDKPNCSLGLNTNLKDWYDTYELVNIGSKCSDFRYRFSDSNMMNLMIDAEDYFNQGNGIVTLCGSTKFFEESMEANRILTFKGWCVYMCGSWGHSYHKDREGNTGTNYDLVKTLHYKKMLMSDCIVIVSDKTNYVGNSTKAEVKFAIEKRLPIFFFNGEKLYGKAFSIPTKTLDRFDGIINDYVNAGNNLGF